VAAAPRRQDHQKSSHETVPDCRGHPGFSADCLETLEEIAQENAEISSTAVASNLLQFPA
jgi:protoheme ferro-lyase